MAITPEIERPTRELAGSTPGWTCGDIHPVAKCCWCGRPFDLWTVGEARFWLCSRAGCAQEQLTLAVTAPATTAEQKKLGIPTLLYVPLPRQIEFHRHPAPNLLLGGAAGGTKSHGLRWDFYMRCLSVRGYNALLLRRTSGELEMTHVDRAALETPRFGGVLTRTGHAGPRIMFPATESMLQFGHCQDDDAVSRYLSSEFDAIGFDELVTFTKHQFLLVSSRARSSKLGVRPIVRAGTNPGGPQAHWVKSYFLDHSVDLGDDPTYNPAEWAYLPARLDDNPYLDRTYERRLLALPKALREAYRWGSWDIFPGQYFTEWRAEKNGKPYHVNRLTVDTSYPRVLGIDWGYVKPGWVGWFVMLPDGRIYLEREWLFQQTVAAEVAKAIKRQTDALGIRVRYTVGDTQMWTPNADSGETTAETFARHGVPMQQADKERVNGWQRCRHWLTEAPDGMPWFVSSPDCPYFNRTLPAAVSDPHKPEDVDTDGEDHACLVAGTRVSTLRGEVDVTQLTLGDRVWTRQGWKPVVALAQTGTDAEVFALTLPDGRALRGTGNHPVWVERPGNNEGRFVPLDAVRYCDIIPSWPETTIGTPESGGARWLDRFPHITTSTTRTATSGITTLPTWRASLGRNIFRFMAGYDRQAQNGARILSGFAHWLLSGMDLRLAIAGMSNTPSVWRKRESRSRSFVLSALGPSGIGRLGLGSSARMPAKRARGWLLALITKPDGVRSVAHPSLPTATLTRESVVAPAVSSLAAKRCVKRENVYNLTVADAHEYLANGILVANCDAARYVLMSRPAPAEKALPKPAPVGSIGWLKAKFGTPDRVVLGAESVRGR